MLATSYVSVINVNDGQDGSPGAQGPQGVSITGTKEQWFLSTSNQRTEGTERTITVDGKSIKVGQWIYEEPALIPDGYYLWGRIETTMSEGNPQYSDAVHRSVISGIKSIVDEDHDSIENKIWETDIENHVYNDGSTMSSVANRVTATESNINGITSRVETVESTYATKAEVGSNNLYVISDQVPGYLHQSSGAIVAQDLLGKEYTSAFIPVNKGDRITIQSWCTPLDGQGEVHTGYSWLAYQFFSDDDPVTPVSNRIDKWGYSSGSGVETTAEGQEHLTYSTFIPEATNVKYIRVSYRSYEDGYAMVEKSATPSEYIINPRDLQDYTDIQVTSAKSEIKQTTDAIELSVSSKVGNNEVISKINQSPEQIKISASKVDIEGAVTFSSLDTTLQNTLNATKAFTGTCTTTAGTSAKVVTSDNSFTMTNGVTITITFSTASTADSPTLNVNSLGAKAIYFDKAVASSTNRFRWKAGSVITFQYNGTNWVVLDYKNIEYTSSSTASDEAIKTNSSTDGTFVLCRGTTINVYFSEANTADVPKLNIDGTGEYSIYYKGAEVNSSNKYLWDAGSTFTFTYNGASRWYMTDGGSKMVKDYAEIVNEKADTGLGMKVNQSSFSGTVDNGECYIHGYTNGVAANVNGYVYWNDVKRIVPKTMINPNKVVPYYTTIYIVLRLDSASATNGTLYMVWYDSDWKYAIIPTPTAIGGTWIWTEATDIVLGQFVEPSSEGAIVDAYLYNPPRNASHIQTTGGNSYQYSKNAVDWVGTNGSSVVTAADIVDSWKIEAVGGTTTINGGLIEANTILTDQLATTAIMSSGYTYTTDSAPYSEVGSFFNLENGDIRSPYFAVDNTTGSAYIDGSISARELYLGVSAGLLNATQGVLNSSNGCLYSITSITGDYIIYDGEFLVIKTENFSIDDLGNVVMTGEVNSSSGSIGSWKIDSDNLHNGSSIGSTGSVYLIPNGSTSSHVIGGSSVIPGWVLTAGNNFGVTKDGTLYANGAVISGEITMTDGEVGGLTVSGDSIYTTSTGISSNQSKYAIWAGEKNGENGSEVTDAAFKVNHNGELTASNANITGTINADSGRIGDFTIINTSANSNLGFNWDDGTYTYWCGFRQKGGSPSQTPGSVRMLEIARVKNEEGARWESCGFFGSDGYLFAKTGSIARWNVSQNYLSYGNMGQNGGIYLIPAGSTSAYNIGGSGVISGWVISAGANFGVTRNGTLYAKDANLTGSINSTRGNIGGFEINGSGIFGDKLKLYSVTDSVGIQVTATGDDMCENAVTTIEPGYVSCHTNYNPLRTITIGVDGIYTNQDISTSTSNGTVVVQSGYNNGMSVTNINDLNLQFMLNNNGNGGIYDVTNQKWGVLYNNANDMVVLYAATCAVRIGAGNTSGTKTFMPRAADGGKSDGVVYCGASDCRWNTVYSKNGTSTSSDERLKKIYRHLGDDHKKLFMELKPIEYSFIDDLDKKHFGLGAQTTEVSMDKFGFGSEYNIVEHSFYDEADTYGRHDTYNMNYIEALVLAIPVVQDHEKEITQLKARITELESKLSQLTQ